MFLVLIEYPYNELYSVIDVCQFAAQKQANVLFFVFLSIFFSVVSNTAGSTFIDYISSSVHSGLTKRNVTL
jgi:hypothetical protein